VAFEAILATSLCLGLSGVAFAQDAAVEGATAASKATQTLWEVTVSAEADDETGTGPIKGFVAKRSLTGSKTDAQILETPQSITVVGAEEIETLKAQSLQDALGYVAGVNRSEGLDRTTDAMTLRGFKSANVGSVFRDGTQYSVNYYNGRQELYGLERVEYLKGASSTLYGASAPGGVINTVSKMPTRQALRELNLEIGSFNRRQVSGDFAGAFSSESDWSYRFTFLKRDSDSFVDFVPDDRDYLATSVRWQPTARTSLTLLAEIQRDKTIYVDGMPAEGTILPNPNGRLSRSLFTGEPGYDKFHLKRQSIGYLFEHAFSDSLKVRNSLRYFKADNAYNYTWSWGLSPDQRSTASRGGQDRWDRADSIISDTSLEYRLMTGRVQHTAIVGFDFSTPKHESERYNRDATNLDLFSPVYGGAFSQAVPAAFSWKSDTKRMGVYAQDQMKIGDKWVVVVGGRQETSKYNSSAFFTGTPSAVDEKTDAFTGRAGVVYLADSGWAPFLNYSESFEPTDGFDRLGNRFKPTEGQQFEAGVRFQPTGSSTMLSAALYQIKLDNVTVADPVAPGFSVQQGQVRSRGLEVEARSRVGRNANVIVAYAYTDSRITQSSPLTPQEVGQRADGVPFTQLSIWGDYSLGAWGLPGLKFGAGVRYVGATRGIAQGAVVKVPSFGLIDAMVSYTTGPWRLALNVTNLADEDYIASCTYGCFFGEPRKAIATMTYRW
jgi:iron complex outermembrane receptor protein